MIVPARPVMAAKTSLFHVPRIARFAISIAERQNVNAMANFVPSTSRGSGSTSSCIAASAFSCKAVLLVIRRVRAFFTQSVNGYAASADETDY